jgi:OOP family OmpA-OmpF porin
MRLTRVLCPVVVLTALSAGGAQAQRFPALGGLDLRGSAIQARAGQDQPGYGAEADLDLGSFILPRARLFAGGTWFNTGTPSVASGTRLRAVGGRAGLRIEPLGAATLAPYVFGGAAGLDVKAKTQDATVQDLLSGFNTGAVAGGGLVFAPGAARRLGITAEGSYTWINNLNHWSVGMGVRIRTFGRSAFDRPAATRVQIVPAAAEAPVVVVPSTRPQAAANDSVYAEIAALRAEIARLAALAPSAAPARDDREDERRLAEAAAALTAERARGDSLAAAAALAAARADSVTRAAGDAAASVAEAQARTGAALLELNRVTSSVTSFRETERGTIVTLGDGLFPSGSAELTTAGRSEVTRVAYALGHFRGRLLRVEGHTDDRGDEAANQALSERRAAAVRAALIAEGIAPERIVAVGYGESRPAAPNATPADRARNRRVEVVITDEHP